MKVLKILVLSMIALALCNLAWTLGYEPTNYHKPMDFLGDFLVLYMLISMSIDIKELKEKVKNAGNATKISSILD